MANNHWKALMDGQITPEFYSILLVRESEQKIRSIQDFRHDHPHYGDGSKSNVVNTKGFETKVKVHKRG